VYNSPMGPHLRIWASDTNQAASEDLGEVGGQEIVGFWEVLKSSDLRTPT